MGLSWVRAIKFRVNLKELRLGFFGNAARQQVVQRLFVRMRVGGNPKRCASVFHDVSAALLKTGHSIDPDILWEVLPVLPDIRVKIPANGIVHECNSHQRYDLIKLVSACGLNFHGVPQN